MKLDYFDTKPCGCGHHTVRGYRDSWRFFDGAFWRVSCLADRLMREVEEFRLLTKPAGACEVCWVLRQTCPEHHDPERNMKICDRCGETHFTTVYESESRLCWDCWSNSQTPIH